MSQQPMQDFMDYDRWVWVDLEMTGLDEQSCVILQAAMVITDSALQELCSIETTIWQPEATLATTIPVVREMHTQNGLLAQARNSTISVQQAEGQLLKLLTKHVAYKQGILTGNSMYVDRRFLQKYMPAFESYLHYRQIDVSSIKILSQEWFGSKGKAPKKPSIHTALDDIRNSMDELRFYRDNCFRANLMLR